MSFTASTAWADIYFPQIVAGGGYQTVVTLMHTDARSTATAASGVLSFYNPDGSARTVTTAELGQGSQSNVSLPVLGTSVITVMNTGPVSVGAAIYKVSGPSVGGVATYSIGNTSVGVVNARPRTAGFIPLVTRSGFDNGVAIQNFSSSPVNVTLRTITANGKLDQTSTPPGLNPLPPFGQFSQNVGPSMGFNSPIPLNGVLEVEAQNNAMVASLPLVSGYGFFSSGAEVHDDDMPLFFPHIVDGSGFTSSIRLFNPFTVPAYGKLNFFDAFGLPRPLPIVGLGMTSSIPLNIQPGQTAVFDTMGTSNGVSVGIGRIDTSAPIGGLSTLFYGSTHIGIPPTMAMRSARIPFYTADGNNTGVAIGTSSSSNLNLSLTQRNGDGTVAQTLKPQPLTPLSANGEYAAFVTQMGFTNTLGIKNNSLQIDALSTGTFLPLGLLQLNSTFSTTATSRQRLFDPPNLAGSYSGMWSMPSFGQGFGGPMTLGLTVDSSNNANFTANIQGNPGTFLAPVPVATASGTFNANGELFITGPLNVRLHNDGAFSAYFGVNNGAVITPTGTLGWMALNGDIVGNKIEGAITLGQTDSTIVTGTFSLTK
jgi:hypothetical protein